MDYAEYILIKKLPKTIYPGYELPEPPDGYYWKAVNNIVGVLQFHQLTKIETKKNGGCNCKGR
jgi:hypothetical protein